MAKKPQLTPLELVRERIKGYDVDYHDSLYRQCMYALGGDVKALRSSGREAGGFGFPVYSDVLVKQLKVGESRRILNTQFIGMSRTMSAEPEPICPQVDKFTAEYRKQIYLARHRAMNWGDQYAHVYLDGYNTGVGWAEIGTRGGKVDIEHCQSYNVIWDRLARTPSRAMWVCFVRYIDCYEAKRRFGKSADGAKVTLYAADGKPMEAVQLFRYMDIGDATGVPTMYTFCGNPDSEPVLEMENPLGEKLPLFWYTYWTPPGMRKPMGRIPMQQAVQEAINELESFNRKQMKQPSITQVDVSQVHPEDMKAIQQGRIPQFIRVTKPSATGYPAIVRYPAAEFPVAAVQLLEMMERQYNADSATTESERGSLSAEKRTLGENELVDQRSSAPSSWGERQASAMYALAIDRIFAAMAAWDRVPTWIDVDGANVLVNDPEDPAMALPRLLEEPSQVLVSEQSIRRVDGERKNALRLAQLKELAPLVGVPGGVSREWFTEEMLKGIGERDPSEAMIDLASPMLAPEAAGLPGQEAMAGM